MATKVKIAREFTFKAYVVANTSEVSICETSHTGEFVTKSECHYYCEKAILDMLRNMSSEALEMSERDNMAWVIYKVSTKEDSKVDDKLVETITVKNGTVKIC